MTLVNVPLVHAALGCGHTAVFATEPGGRRAWCGTCRTSQPINDRGHRLNPAKVEEPAAARQEDPT